MRAMVVLSIIAGQAGYFIRIPKCFLVPEKVMTYLEIQCDSLRSRFSVPEERVAKYLPLLHELEKGKYVSFSEIEVIVGKLVSLECAVPAGMWYARFQYAPTRETGLSLTLLDPGRMEDVRIKIKSKSGSQVAKH